jgi:hypothetical protein
MPYHASAPIPFTGLPVIAGDATLDHFVAPLMRAQLGLSITDNLGRGLSAYSGIQGRLGHPL